MTKNDFTPKNFLNIKPTGFDVPKNVLRVIIVIFGIGAIVAAIMGNIYSVIAACAGGFCCVITIDVLMDLKNHQRTRMKSFQGMITCVVSTVVLVASIAAYAYYMQA